MNTCTIDGSQSLSQQESAIRAYEAAACELLALLPLVEDAPSNEASFRELDAGTILPPIHLTSGVVPAKATWVCFATIYVSSKLVPVSAYRQ